eukprot:3169760-Karenia_brevis.AAC.1
MDAPNSNGPAGPGRRAAQWAGPQSSTIAPAGSMPGSSSGPFLSMLTTGEAPDLANPPVDEAPPLTDQQKESISK